MPRSSSFEEWMCVFVNLALDTAVRELKAKKIYNHPFSFLSCTVLITSISNVLQEMDVYCGKG